MEQKTFDDAAKVWIENAKKNVKPYCKVYYDHGLMLLSAVADSSLTVADKIHINGHALWKAINENPRKRDVNFTANHRDGRISWQKHRDLTENNTVSKSEVVLRTHPNATVYHSSDWSMEFDVQNSGVDAIQTAIQGVTGESTFSVFKQDTQSSPAKAHPLKICHISDLHFGVHHDALKFYGVDAEFSRTTYFVNFLREQKGKGERYDLLVISGDITSIAADDEFQDFRTFLDLVRRVGILPEDNFYERVILVPGNHEVRRGENASRGDYLKAFSEFVEGLKKEGRFLSTPYSRVGEGACVLSEMSEDGVPFALHNFPDLGVQIVTLVSCFYSQGLNEKACKLVKDYEDIRDNIRKSKQKTLDLDAIGKYFEERVYSDRGFYSPDYAGAVPFGIQKYLSGSKTNSDILRVAVAHHPATKYFSMDRVEDTKHGDILIKALKNLGFSLYLHGHIHCAPEKSDGDIVELAASTLGCKAVEEASRFNHLEWNAISRNTPPKIRRVVVKQGKFNFE